MLWNVFRCKLNTEPLNWSVKSPCCLTMLRFPPLPLLVNWIDKTITTRIPDTLNTLLFVIKNHFCFTRFAHNSLVTDKPVALWFPIELEFLSVGFYGGRKPEELGKNSRNMGWELTYMNLNPQKTPGPEIKLGTVGSEQSHYYSHLCYPKNFEAAN